MEPSECGLNERASLILSSFNKNILMLELLILILKAPLKTIKKKQ